MALNEHKPVASPPIWEKFDDGNWEDLRFPVMSLNPPGLLSDPDVDATDGTLLFDAASTELIFGIAQLPHSWEPGTDIYPHIHWSPSTTNVGTVHWRFEYEVQNVMDVFTGLTEVNVVSTTSGVTDKHQFSVFGATDMTNKEESCIMKWKLSRIGGDDTYTGDAKLLEFDIHYRIGRMGTEERLPD